MTRRLIGALVLGVAVLGLTGCAQSPNGTPIPPGQPRIPTTVTVAPPTVTVAPPTVTVAAGPCGAQPQQSILNPDPNHSSIDAYILNPAYKVWDDCMRKPPVTVTAPPPPPVTVTTTAPSPAPKSESKPQEPQSSSDGEIRADAASAFDVVNTYWENLFATWKDPQGHPVYWYRSDLYRGDGFYDSARGEDFYCGAGEGLGPTNAAFCGPDAALTGKIAWDMQLFREQENRFGDAPVYAIIAHEVGHAAQARFRFDDEAGAAPPPRTVAAEQQADCLSGASLAKAEQEGLTTADPGDFDEIVDSFMALETQDGGDHGDAADRLHAFRHGYGTGDVESCLYNQGVPPPGMFG